jgi:hypothetical protein
VGIGAGIGRGAGIGAGIGRGAGIGTGIGCGAGVNVDVVDVVETPFRVMTACSIYALRLRRMMK